MKTFKKDITKKSYHARKNLLGVFLLFLPLGMVSAQEGQNSLTQETLTTSEESEVSAEIRFSHYRSKYADGSTYSGQIVDIEVEKERNEVLLWGISLSTEPTGTRTIERESETIRDVFPYLSLKLQAHQIQGANGITITPTFEFLRRYQGDVIDQSVMAGVEVGKEWEKELNQAWAMSVGAIGAVLLKKNFSQLAENRSLGPELKAELELELRRKFKNYQVGLRYDASSAVDIKKSTQFEQGLEFWFSPGHSEKWKYGGAWVATKYNHPFQGVISDKSFKVFFAYKP